MNPMLSAALGSILRWALALASGYLIRAGVWTDANAELYVGAATLALISLGWSQYQKYQSRRVLVTALASPRRQSETEVVALIASGAPVPSVTTPAAAVPVVASQP